MTQIIHPVKDEQSVTPDGELVGPKIDGLLTRRLRPIEDKRGDITEMYSSSWGISTEPVIYAYQVTIRPNAIRGWELHKQQTDRIFISQGSMRWAFYDNRPDSPTYKLLNVFVLGELSRTLVIVPTGIFHAVQNVGPGVAIFVNFPTHPYNHSDPDKYRLPLKNDLIPFDFADGPGW